MALERARRVLVASLLVIIARARIQVDVARSEGHESSSRFHSGPPECAPDRLDALSDVGAALSLLKACVIHMAPSRRATLQDRCCR